MTRTIVGPFNRVEGDLEVGLDIVDGVVARAEVTTTLYRGFEQILVGRPPMDALAVAPRICGICSVSQSVAAATALRLLTGEAAAPNGLIATNVAHAAENIADHLTHFYLFFMPDFAREEYRGRSWFELVERRFKAVKGTAAGDLLPARRRLLESMGIIAGKWPHSLAFQPGGTTRAIDVGERVQLLTLVGELQSFLERFMFGVPLIEILSMETLEELETYREKNAARADFAAFLTIAEDLSLGRMGRGPGALLSYGAYHGSDGPWFAEGLFRAGRGRLALDPGAITEDVTHAWMEETDRHPGLAVTNPDAFKPGAYSWAKAPRLGGEPVEVGAIARQVVSGHPLILDVIGADGGTSVRGRIVARLIETAILAHAMTGWLRSLALKAPFCNTIALPDSAESLGLVEAARGALGHWLKVENGALSHYQIIAPTTWNFSPRDRNELAGPLEGALEGLEVGAAGARAAAIQHVVRSFDPCMVCTAH